MTRGRTDPHSQQRIQPLPQVVNIKWVAQTSRKEILCPRSRRILHRSEQEDLRNIRIGPKAHHLLQIKVRPPLLCGFCH